jgi:phospholipase D1/2
MKMKQNFLLPHAKEGERILLHGLLHVRIVQANDLVNLDKLACCGLEIFDILGTYTPSVITNNKSDAYVSVSTDDQRLAKTRTINDNLNPIWNESFIIPVAHYTKNLIFSVYDADILGMSQFIGAATLSVEDLIEFDEATRKPLRVGVHKVVQLLSEAQGEESRGQLEYFIELIPYELEANEYCDNFSVPGVYFKGHEGNEVKLYVNADDGDDMAPSVRYGGPNNDDKVWHPPRLWRDIYDAICDAKHFIYITGWAVDTTQSLLRGKEREEALANGKYSPYIGDLLKQKANEGVTVNMLVWDDATSNTSIFRPVGFMGTHDEESKKFFQGSKVNFRLASMLGGKENILREKMTQVVLFTHHQKIVVLDAVCTAKPTTREPLAFVGGIDLTNGRWDNRKHPLFRTLDTDHKGDAYNGCFAVDAANVGPREPWHDIHSSVRGPAAMDVIANFQERWFKQAPDAVGDLLDLTKLGLTNPLQRKTEDAWCSQVLRSIDERTAVFDKARCYSSKYPHANSYNDSFSEGEKETRLKEILHASKEKLKRTGQKFKNTFHDTSITGERTTSFKSSHIDGYLFTRRLSQKKGRLVDNSMHKGWLHHIRRSKHMVYIESQYFLGSSHLWSEHKSAKCGNLIPAEITFKICQKIAKGERYSAYILVPLWPEGISESSSVQAILYWQKLTMEAMYRRIAATLKRFGMHNVSPKDYLNFYALANRETDRGAQASKMPLPGTAEEVLTKTRRHQVYVHSKMLIADDAFTIIGSANINQRSMDGTRDSEIAVASYQPAFLPTETSVAHGDVHAFRIHCWATITNIMEEVFKDPSSLSCVRRLNAIAEENWKDFVSSGLVDMDSHLIPYPIDIDEDGRVFARKELNGFFPDTAASIVGNYSKTLPEILTT